MFLTPLAALALALSACDYDKYKPGMDAEAITPFPEKSAADQMFIDMMVPHHEGAIAMATIALERAEHAELKTMAQGVITAQQGEIAKMKEWRKKWFGSDVTPAMGAPMPGMKGMEGMEGDMAALKSASPFDLAFLDAMVMHHQGAVTMAKEAHDKTQMPEIKELSTKIIDDQKKEIAQMRDWRRAWFPDTPELPKM